MDNFYSKKIRFNIFLSSYFSIKKVTILLVLLLNTMLINAQNIEIRGRVTSSDGSPIIGANVAVKGTTIGTITNINGSYSIPDVPRNAVLVFSFVGMVQQEVPVNGRININVTLDEAEIGLDEVVVIGYGTTKKADLTGAVSVIKTDDINKVPVTSIGEAMQGFATGVFVRSSGGIGSEPYLEIRGIGNFSNNAPLYIIDGVPTSGNRDFNANDIESIQILKDASAAAIYGSRAANGVIIITTKKGVSGELKVDFSSKMSLQKLPVVDIMKRDEWIKYTDMAYDNAIADGVANVTARLNHPADIDTDWLGETFKTGVVQDYNLTLSGGSTNGTYLVSMNYLDNSGTFVETGMKRYSFRVNTEGHRGIFSIGQNLSISNTWVDEGGSLYNTYRMLPTIPIYDDTHNGGFGFGNELQARTFGTNPIAYEKLNININENLRLRGNIYLDIDILKSLRYRANLALETNNRNSTSLRKVGDWTLNQAYSPSSLSKTKGNYLATLLEHTLTFKETFGKHNVDAFIGTTFERNYTEVVNASQQSLIQIGETYFETLDAGTSNPTATGNKSEEILLSYLGRVNYSFDNKYLATLTFRRDGSSKFAVGNQWGNFPSLSLGWRISKENFFKVPWINDLKIRANYGSLGNSSISPWQYVPVINTNPRAVFGTDQHLEVGMTQVQLVNEDIKWETKIQKNFGFDLTTLDNRLLLTAEYFISTTKDVLTPLPILMTTGNSGGAPYVNAASLENRGIEISTTWRDQIGDLNYSITGNYTRLRNKVLEFGYGKTVDYTTLTKTEIGEPLGMFYMIRTNGIFQNYEEIQAHKNSQGVVIQPNARPGDIRYVDWNDDGQITSALDRQICGNPWPKFEVGLNLTANYKNWNFALVSFGSFGHDVYSTLRFYQDQFHDNCSHRSGVNPWMPDNTDTDFPRIVFGDDRNALGDIDRWLEKGSFWKLSQVSIGYTLSSLGLLQMFDNLNITVTGQNVLILTNYSGPDPDFTPYNIWQKGVDNWSYPVPRGITFSLTGSF